MTQKCLFSSVKKKYILDFQKSEEKHMTSIVVFIPIPFCRNF